MELDENIMQTRTVGTICEIIKEAMDDMHPYSYGFKKFNDIIKKRDRAMKLLGSYAVNKGSVLNRETGKYE
tara:strand:+ start:177 stop:389 length:213 start_codon:yes stop_codon:yes gene_type:complete